MGDKLLFLGDVFLPKPYPGVDVIEHDYVFNLEYPITSSSDAMPGKINLKSDSYYVKETFGRNPLAVCLANNHIVDYGEQGIRETIEVLEKEGVAYFGAGTRANNFGNPLVLKTHGVALLGYCGTRDIKKLENMLQENRPAPMDLDLIKEDISNARECDLSPIVQLHWGVEESAWPSSENVEFARKLVDSGAEMVLFHHAHTVQPVEYYKNKLIAYCLGNFLFDDILVPRNFDREGNPLSYYKKVQERWNRQSIGVLFSPREFQVEIRGYKFSSGRVRALPKSLFTESRGLRVDDSAQLEERVKKSLGRRYIYRRLKLAASDPMHFIYKIVLRLLGRPITG